MPKADRLWPGSTIACLATGPSMTQEDAEYCRGRARIIAINDAHRLAPFADVLFSADRQWWRHYKGVPGFEGLKYGIGSSPGKSNPIRECPDVSVLKNVGYSGLDMNGGLCTGRNSGHSAVNLAVLLGAQRIVLLGYNMGHTGGQAHFFGDHPDGLPQREYMYPSFRKSFETIVEPLRVMGIEIFNCTANTALSAFPLRELRDVLPQSTEVAA